MVRERDLEFIITEMVKYLKESIRMINVMERVNMFGKKDIMREISRMEKKMDKV